VSFLILITKKINKRNTYIHTGESMNRIKVLEKKAWSFGKSRFKLLVLVSILLCSLINNLNANGIVTAEGYAWNLTTESVKIYVVFWDDGHYQVWVTRTDDVEIIQTKVADGLYSVSGGLIIVENPQRMTNTIVSITHETLVLQYRENIVTYTLTPFVIPETN